MASQGRLEGERSWLSVRGGIYINDFPDLGGMVGATSGQFLDVWREENARDALLVSVELGNWQELSSIIGLDKVPDKNVALVVRSTEQRAIASYGDARDGDVLLWDKLVRAIVLGKIPNAHASVSIAADDLALVGVNHDIVGGASVRIASLDGTRTGLPDLDSAVLGASYHPLPFAVKCDAGNVARVAFKGMKRIGVGGLDVVELDSVVACGGEESLVR